MNKLTKKIFSVISASALVLNVASPVLAVDYLSISGNGYDSNNDIDIDTNTATIVKQTNSATVTNTVSTTSKTGGNTASYNTGGDSYVFTGDADSRVTIANTLNTNQASVACCGEEGMDISIDGNGADSRNDIDFDLNDSDCGGSYNPVAEVVQKYDMTVLQDNKATVVNDIEADAKTGYNDADKNTGGASVIMTGDADSRVGVTTTANSNWAAIGSTETTGAGLSAYISGNGYDSNNDVDFDLHSSTGVFQDNKATVTNLIDSDAKSGGNEADRNTGGDVEVYTGNATSVAGIENSLNFNWADVNCCAVFDLEASIWKNGTDTHNEIDFDLHNSRIISQKNRATVTNDVESDSGTGYNDADKNTGGEVKIMTGNAESLVGIANEANFNYASMDCCVFGLGAEIAKNGYDSRNDIDVDRYTIRETWQKNLAGITNTVDGEDGGAYTGYNDADKNTGDPDGDPGIMTGNALAMTSIANSVNVNSDDVLAFELPGFAWQVEFAFSWTRLLSIFGW